MLRHFTGLSYEEIGETLGVPAKTVKSRLHTARTRLAAMLVAGRCESDGRPHEDGNEADKQQRSRRSATTAGLASEAR